jgi:hypothetical protein
MNAGSYQFVEGPKSFADMDKQWPANADHDKDYEMNISPKLQAEVGPFYYAYRDTLSYNPEIESEKSVVTVTHIKNGKMAPYMQEARRTAAVSSGAVKAPFGVVGFVQLFAGSDPTFVTIRSLKDGMKELETNYFNRPADEFKNNYIKMYSQELFDKRSAALNDDVTNREVYISKMRKDLSSPMK